MFCMMWESVTLYDKILNNNIRLEMREYGNSKCKLRQMRKYFQPKENRESTVKNHFKYG